MEVLPVWQQAGDRALRHRLHPECGQRAQLVYPLDDEGLPWLHMGEGAKMKTVIEMAREAGDVLNKEWLARFAELVRADEREVITDEWSMCVQSDLEHGVKSLNEQAAKDWFKNYPEIAKFGAWLNARSNT